MKKKRVMHPDTRLRELLRTGEDGNNFKVPDQSNKCSEQEKDCARCKIRDCPEEKT